MAKVIVFGSLNMDLSVVCGRMPREGETVMGSGFFTNAGGKGGNQAVAAVRAGVETHMIARVGADEFGRRLTDGLEWYGVRCDAVCRAEGYPTGTAVIIRCEGENRIIVDPGANLALGPDEAIADFDAIAEEGDILLTQLECSLETTGALLAHAHARGVRTVLNAAPAFELPEALYRDLDILCVNETECERLSGVYPADRWRQRDALGFFEVDEMGLDWMDNKILSTLAQTFMGHPVGLSTLASAVGEDAATLEDVYEPFLLQQGLINRTPKGRVATPRAFEHLGLPVAEADE